jgi:hypothetical protein
VRPKRTFVLFDNGGCLNSDPWPRLQIAAEPIGTAWMVDVHRIHGVIAGTEDLVVGDVLLSQFLMDRESIRDLAAMVSWLGRLGDYLSAGQLPVSDSELLRWSAREVTES